MFQGLEKRWHKCISSGGDYFGGDGIDLEKLIKIFYFTNEFTSLFAESSVKKGVCFKFE